MAGWKRGAISADFKKAAAGFCLVVILAIFVPRSQIEWPQSLVGRVAATPAMLALELPHDVDEFERFVRTTQQRGLIKAAILNDQLAVLGWMVFFAVFAATVRNERAAILLAALVAVTFSFDLLEKGAIREMLKSSPAVDLPEGMSAVLGAASLKYLGVFSIFYSVSQVVIKSHRTWERSLGLLLRTAAAAGIFGTVASFLSSSARPIVAVAIDVAGVVFGVLIVASAWEEYRLRYPRRLVPATKDEAVS